MKLQYVDASDIESVCMSELNKTRLDTLLHGYSPFEIVLKNSSDPIALDKKGGMPYKIIDGRHRIFLARQKRYCSLAVVFV